VKWWADPFHRTRNIFNISTLKKQPKTLYAAKGQEAEEEKELENEEAKEIFIDILACVET
jgi:hypothetical protein